DTKPATKKKKKNKTEKIKSGNGEVHHLEEAKGKPEKGSEEKSFSSFEAKNNKKVKEQLDLLRTGKGTGKKMVGDLKIEERDLAAFVVSGVESPKIKELRDNLKSQGGWTAQATITRLTTIRVEYAENKLNEINSRIK